MHEKFSARACLALSLFLPVIVLLIWHSHSNFYVVFDDGEYWHQSYSLLRKLQSGEYGWKDVYYFAEGRPTTNSIYGLAALSLTGWGLEKSAKLLLSMFLALFSMGIFLFVRKVTLSPAWALVISLWVCLQANYFVTAQIFMSELPYLAYLAVACYAYSSSNQLEKKIPSLVAAFFAALGICSRPAEALFLFGLLGIALAVVQMKNEHLRLRSFAPGAIAMATAAIIISLFTDFHSHRPQLGLYPLFGVFLALFFSGYFFNVTRERNLNFALGIGTLTLTAWFLPRVNQLKSWFQAGTFFNEINAGDFFDPPQLLAAAEYIWDVFNSVAGPQLLFFSLLIAIALLREKKLRAGSWIWISLFIFICAALPGSFVRNVGARNAVDRYYLGPLLLLHVSIGCSIWNLNRTTIGKSLLRKFLCACVVALVILNHLLIFNYIYFQKISLAHYFQKHIWLQRAHERASIRNGLHYGIEGTEKLSRIIPNGKAKILFTGPVGKDSVEGIFSMLNLRSLEKNHGWEIVPGMLMSPKTFSKKRQNLKDNFQYVLIGPVTKGLPAAHLLPEVSKFPLFGAFELPIGHENDGRPKIVRLEVYRIR